MGAVLPGCPETYQSFRQSETRIAEVEEFSRRFADKHQKIHRFRHGDVIAVPAGVVTWFYNDGDSPLVAVTVHDVSNDANQLDSYHRVNFLAS
jgi:mannose-6-phosphate isomerase-like protein (cupin superfamily)